MSHEKGIDAAITAALITDVIPIDGMDGVRIDDYLKYNASDAVELGVKLRVGEDGKPRWHGYSDIRNDEYDDCNRAILRPVVKAAIKAYLDASGMVMVPKDPTREMHNEWEEGYCKGFNDLPDRYERMNRDSAFHCFTTAHHAMIAAAPNPFADKQEEEPVNDFDYYDDVIARLHDQPLPNPRRE